MKLIDFAEVKRMASERGCKAKRIGKFGCEITDKTGAIINSDQNGFWKPIEVMRACYAAHLYIGRLPISIKPPKGLDTGHHGLREALIVEMLAADGVTPYKHGQRTIALEALLRCELGHTLMFADVNRRVRAAAMAVVDAGLAELTLGPRGGWSVAYITWTPAARQKGRHLTADEDDAIVTAGRPPVR